MISCLHVRSLFFQLLLLFFCCLSSSVFAEYRAYELEVFDRIEKKREIVITSFSPNDYILLHGGPVRIGVIIRASWICWGDTSRFKEVCPMPDAVRPQFEVGDRVQVTLNKHVTHRWIGVIENRFYRPDLKSNVYGVRFPKRDLYTRYYEATLQKAP